MERHHGSENLSNQPADEFSACRLPPLPRLCPQGTYVYKGVLFFSKSEAALATLLEKYVPGYSTMPGDSFQVPIGQGRQVDYKVDDVLVEYHPIRPLHELRERREYHRWREELRSCHGDEKTAFRRESHDCMTERYRHRREQAIDESPEFHGRELIVATSPREFLDQVIKRFGFYGGSNNKFEREFSDLINDVKEVNRRTRYQYSKRTAA